MGNDGKLVTWSKANKFAAFIILLLQPIFLIAYFGMLK